jgi:cardiolipin synthase
MSSQHQVANHQLALLQNGTEFFPQLCADIATAQYSIYLETYRFADDGIGRRVAASLQQAAARGVVVRVLLDGFGSAELSPDWLEEWRIAGVEVRWFRREISILRIRRHRLRRLHRKLVVIDGETAYIGGINMVDDVPIHADLTVPQLDYAVRVRGAVVRDMQHAMRHLWGAVSWANFRRRSGRLFVDAAAKHHRAAVSPVVFVVRDNVRHRRDIEKAYLRAIADARSEVVIANAYFLPGRVFRRILKQAAQRGVRVVLLLQGKVEYAIQHYATHFLYDGLLDAGVEIYEYQASYLHAKVAVVDGQWATVGSSNIDPFSLLLAREANLLVGDAGFAGALRDSLFVAIAKDARRIQANRRDYLTRLLSRISYGLVRFLIGITGVAKRR